VNGVNGNRSFGFALIHNILDVLIFWYNKKFQIYLNLWIFAKFIFKLIQKIISLIDQKMFPSNQKVPFSTSIQAHLLPNLTTSLQLYKQ